MEIVFWLPVLNLHWIETIRKIQELNSEPVKIVVWKDLGGVRLTMGWETIYEKNIQVIKLREGNWWQIGYSVLKTYGHAIHVFSGLWATRQYFLFIVAALLGGNKVAILNEPYSISATGYVKNENQMINHIKVKLRPLLYQIARSVLYSFSKNQYPCIFPLSLIARDQFIRAGFKTNTLFPFGYFIEKQNTNLIENESQNKFIKLIFVGNIIERKGIDILINALIKVNEQNTKCTLDIYGSGQNEKFIPSTLSFVAYKGIIPQSKVQQTISGYDFLVLPSRHDGWGVVVNEAILQGVPVIISDSVGAKCIIENSNAGIIFKNEDVDDLVRIISEITENPYKIDDMKKCAKELSNQITPTIAAKYFTDVLKFYFYDMNNGKRPFGIWCGLDMNI